tara:strand:+ start:4706 stop:4948 length:243 start_codon:yes stop_codon:yes gene_type:complete
MKCLKCDVKIERELETKVLIGAVELISYATHRSKHNYGKGNNNGKVLNFCICDTCYGKSKKNSYKLVSMQNGKLVRGDKS